MCAVSDKHARLAIRTCNYCRQPYKSLLTPDALLLEPAAVREGQDQRKNSPGAKARHLGPRLYARPGAGTVRRFCSLLSLQPAWTSIPPTHALQQSAPLPYYGLAVVLVHNLTSLGLYALQVGQQSKAAMSMCLWVRAMDTYATVYRIVEPKRKILAEAQAALDASNAALAQKQAQLQAIKDKVAALQQQLTDTQKQLAALQFQASAPTGLYVQTP